VWGGLDARALFEGAVYPLSHHLALKRWLVSSKAQSMIGHRASVQSAVDRASSFKRVFVFPYSSGGGLNSFFFEFCSVDPFCFSLLLSSHFVTSVLVACLRCELRPSLVRPLAST